MTIFATIRPPRTTVNHVWQVGPLSSGAPAQHPQNSANTRSVGSINFLAGQATSSGGAVVQRLGRKNVSFNFATTHYSCLIQTIWDRLVDSRDWEVELLRK